jgi:hypothetical protein
MVFSKMRQMLRGKEIMLDKAVYVEEKAVLPTGQTLTMKKKRDIFRFAGEKDISINLEHVTSMFVEGKRITFQFYQTATFVDLEDDEAAKKAYENIIGIWSTDAK